MAIDEQQWLDAWSSQTAAPIIETCRPDVEVHAVPLPLENGKKNVLALYQDISQRLEAQSALRESEEMFRMLSATAPVGIVLVDDTGNLTYVNEQYLRITGLQLEDAHGTAWKAEIHPDDLQRVLDILGVKLD